MSTSNHQIAFKPGDAPDFGGENALAQIRVFVPPHTARPSSRSTFMRHFPPDAVADLIGHGSEADLLRRSIELPVQGTLDPERAAELTAIWRAFHVYLRWTGAPFAHLENILQKDEPRWRLDESALVLLSEGAAYITSAASDLLGMNPDTMHFRSLGFFSTEVELGMPALLAPFLYLNHRGDGSRADPGHAPHRQGGRRTVGRAGRAVRHLRRQVRRGP